MNKQQIDRMMQDLPSQVAYKTESVTESIVAGLIFGLFVLIIMLT